MAISAKAQSERRGMLVSVEKNRYIEIDHDKVRNGAFFTRGDNWLTSHVSKFITQSGLTNFVDPFAGEGHIFQSLRRREIHFQEFGYDINSVFGFTVNDSLVNVPRIERGIVITNPPYLAKHSASRKGVRDEVNKHYVSTGRDYLYQVALDKCIETYSHVVAIIPETVINSGYPLDRLVSLTVVESADFTDTDCPICVCCFGPDSAGRSKALVYRGEEALGTLGEIESHRVVPTNSYKLTFNDPNGQLALQAVDTSDPNRPIGFLHRQASAYNVSGIKHSSRLVTFISSPCFTSDDQIKQIAHTANVLLEELRTDTYDLIFSPFKGNRKDGTRRRRLDYRTARAILKRAIRQQDTETTPHGTLWDCDR